MIERIDHNFHIDASRIPTVKTNPYETHYRNRDNEVALRTKKGIGEVLSPAFARLGPHICGHYQITRFKNCFLVMQSALPADLKIDTQILESSKENNLIISQVVSLFINPTKVGQFINFFEKYTKQQLGLDSDTIWLINMFTSELKEEVKKRKRFSLVNKDLITDAELLKEKIWEIYKVEMRTNSTTIMNEDAERSRIHELVHSVTFTNKWKGIVGKLIDQAAKLRSRLEIKYHYMDEDKRPDDHYEKTFSIKRLKKLIRLLQGLIESEAIIHQILGSTILTNTDKYSHPSWCFRLSTILELYQPLRDSKKKLKIDNVLDVKEVPEKEGSHFSFLEHATGILFILYAQDIDIESLMRSLDFSHVTDLNPSCRKASILKKVEYLIDHPEIASKMVLYAYDSIQELLKSVINQFNYEFFDLFKCYPDLMDGVEPELLSELSSYTSFIQNNQTVTEEKPIHINPVVN